MLFITGGMVRVRWRKWDFGLGERVKRVRTPSKSTLSVAGRVALLLFGIALWLVAILLLLEVTRQLLEVLRFIVELGAVY